MALDMNFLNLGVPDDDPITMSPSTSLLDFDMSFADIGDSFFPNPSIDTLPETLPNTQELDTQAYLQAAPLRLDTAMPLAQSMPAPFQGDEIGDRFFKMQQAGVHGRQPSITSPAIVLGDQPLGNAIPAGLWGDRDFINGSEDIIYLQADSESASGLDLDLHQKLQNGYKVQRSQVPASNMNGIAALQIGLATICQETGKIPFNQSTLVTYLAQQVSKEKDTTAPQVQEGDISKPLLLQHLLMIVHRCSQRNNEEYNISIIRPSSPHPPPFGAAAVYTISRVGPRNNGSKTIWLYENAGRWYPLARNEFTAAPKSYAEALRQPVTPIQQRPVTPTSSNAAFLHASIISPSTQNTPSEAGSDFTSVTSTSICRSCGKKCEGQSELAHHHRNHRPRTLTCMQVNCGKSFLYSKDLKRHERTHVNKDTRMDFTCEVPSCTKAYTRLDNLRRHQRQDHPNFVAPPPSITSSRHSHGRSRQG